MQMGISVSTFEELILRCIWNVQFHINGTRHGQKDGVKIDSLLEPLLTNIFLARLKMGLLEEIIPSLKMYAHYVDDAFSI